MVSRLARSAAAIAALIMLIMMVMIVAEVVARQVFHHSFLIVDELAGYMLAGTTFLGLAQTFRRGKFLRIEFLLARIGGRAARLYSILLGLIGLGFCAILTLYTAQLVISSFTRGVTSATIFAIPLYIPQTVIPVGCALLTLCLLERLLDDVRALRVPAGPAHG